MVYLSHRVLDWPVCDNGNMGLSRKKDDQMPMMMVLNVIYVIMS